MSETIVFPELLSTLEYERLPAQEKEIYVKEILRKTLQLNQSGLTVSQLKSKLPFDRRIIEKHLSIMEFTNEIYSFKLGSNRIYIPNHKAMHEATSYSERLGKNEYQVYTLHNKLGDFAIIQQKDLEKNYQDVTGGLQIPLEHYEKFVTYLQKSITAMERRGMN